MARWVVTGATLDIGAVTARRPARLGARVSHQASIVANHRALDQLSTAAYRSTVRHPPICNSARDILGHFECLQESSFT